MPQPDLREVLPVRARRTVYTVYVILTIAVSGTQVGYAAIPDGVQPIWLTVVVAVTAFLGTPVGALAVTNTPAAAEAASAEPTRATDPRDLNGDGRDDQTGRYV